MGTHKGELQKVKKEVDKRESLRVVTANNFILAEGIADLSLNARKMLYLALAQCKKNDPEFYEYSITPAELAGIWGISRQRVYQQADEITDELMKLVIKVSEKTGKRFKKRHVFFTCDYDDDSKLTFKLHKEMTDLLLGVNKDFSKPLLWDFMRMRSPYSMAIWHLMQKEMHSTKPMMTRPIEFDLSLEELRQATNTQDKFERLSQFKERVLDKAIREIRENCLVNIHYDYLRKGRAVTGFRFVAESYFGTMRPEDMTLRERQRMRKAQLIHKQAMGILTEDEALELEYLRAGLYQMTIEDVINNYPE